MSGIGYGYNLDLPLDRDRNCVTNYSDFQIKANRIIFYIIDNINRYRSEFDNMDYTEIEMLNNFPTLIYNLLNQSAGIFSILYSDTSFVSQNSANFFWELNAQKKA